MDRFTKITFVAAIVLTLVFALSPHPPVLIDYDKAQHGLAFVVLAILGRCAYPRAPWQLIALALAGFGGAIEVVQLIPALHRTSDIYDWYADIAATGLGLMLSAITMLFMATRETDHGGSKG